MADRIRIDYERGEEPMIWSDALWLTQAQIDALGPEGIEAEQDARYARWIAVLTAPAPDPGSEPPATPPVRDPD